MKNFPELIHIAAHLPKVVLRVAEGSTDKEEGFVEMGDNNWLQDVSDVLITS